MARQSKTGGKKTKATARKASPARDAKAAKIKRSVVPKLGKGRSVAELQAKLDFKTRELDEALAQQKATAEVLQVISNSSGDLPLVFDTMLDKAMHLCGAEFGVLANYDGETFRTAATRGLPYKYAAHRARSTRGYGPGTAPFRHLKGEPLVHIVDLMDSDAYRAGEPNRRALVDLGGARCLLCVPLLSDRRVIGCVMIFRQEARPFGDRQIALLKYFAAQAVIAIENARLFNETKEALERQTATADILKVIARSPADVQPVFDAIAKSAKRLSGAHSVVVTRVAADMVQLAAFTAESEAADQELQASYPFPLSSSRVHSQVARSGKIKLQTNIESDPEIPQTSKDLARARGYRSLVVVPMLREGGAIGTIGVSRREAGPFTENILHLLCAFADQAVIAIENARLFKETQEALEQQKASADILSVISNSVADTQPVFDKILHSIENLFESEFRVIFLFGDDELLHVGAMHGPNADQVRSLFPIAVEGTGSELAIRERRLVRYADVLNDPEVPTGLREHARRVGRTYSTVIAPMLWEDRAIGSIQVSRATMVPFSEKECNLLRTFADQAVIAIQNAQLFNETREALERQTATADILKVIASSPDDVQPVFQAIAERSNRLVEGLSTGVYSLHDDILHLMAFTTVSPEADAVLQASFPAPLSKFNMADAIRNGEIFSIGDAEVEFATRPSLQEMARLRGWRSVLFVPLLRDQKTIGMISVNRVEPGPFVDHHILLLRTFADQAVIAISNVEMFQEVRQRTRELSASLDDLRTAQDRLVQTEKLASLGQLTAGIAHEIKNPLNFVNNFSALSVELIDELDETLAPAPLDQKIRGDVGELTQMLRSNLEKVVQHGKRADSIVKNMLLHSRERAGEHRSADINALVEESLNLAYHGARAEKPGFNIALTRDLDPDAGAVELYPQEITRALLNLISNGFYAATRRKSEAEDDTFEPMLGATTKNLSNKVEIRIRDNGTGIPTEVKEKMFNPFFTTKPAGEGTGLGLSMSHDIIVKQHGGSIDVETEPGVFTEFIITLPRNMAGKAANEGTN